ncbi:MAG: acetyl esterase/lipase [Myxococcota bacterium]|jgi:acetyl esterase/lipase
MIRDLRRRALGTLRSLDLRRTDDVPYGPDPAQQLTVWTPLTPRPAAGWPTLLMLHGGGWVSGSRRDFDSFAPTVALRGVQCVAAGYRLGPRHRWPTQQEDTLTALDALPELVDADPSRLVTWGHSAGGQLALLAAAHRPLAGAVALGAPADLRAIVRPAPDVFDNHQLDDASPAHMLRPGPEGPPIFLVHGEQDRVCPVDQARALHAALPQRCTLVTVPGGNHGLHWPPLRCHDAKQRAVRWALERLH